MAQLLEGSVFSNQMKAIPNVNIEVVGENRFVKTDTSGKFKIIFHTGNELLRFSHVGYDFDTISVSEFKKTGYIELYPPSLNDVTITNNHTKKDNTWLFILGVVVVGAVVYAVNKDKPQKVKA
jgi:hypothetical protein